MNSYKFDSIINRQEADALKEMIFKRAKERAESIESESTTNYSTAIKNDVMELARDTFTSNKNPFSVIKEEPVKKEIAKEKPVVKPTEYELGFSQKNIEAVKAQIKFRNETVKNEIASSEISETMAEARSEFQNKSTFMGALNFLNSQAAISLINKRSKGLDTLA